jgi:CDP-glucose 4,6-dehydratase
MENMEITDLGVFKGKKVLITGHTGFKGSWLAIWMEMLGARVAGISLDPENDKCVFSLSRIGDFVKDYRADIRDLSRMQQIFAGEQPEIVFHLAAQPLVLESYRAPIETFAINTQGTANILEAIRNTPSVQAAVMVTTDKCYENLETLRGYRESDPMGGHDPYSASKGAAEIVIASYRRSFFSTPETAAIASARSGNVVGGGDWSANRLVPDIIRAVETEKTLDVRHPEAVRPWQHVLEPLSGYMLLAARLLDKPEKYAQAWNFGPYPSQVYTVRQIADAFFQRLGAGAWRDASDPANPHEAGLLMLDIEKAVNELGWSPALSFDETVRMTADWYARYRREDALQLCRNQIQEYAEIWSSAPAN